jgi:hypothetical protein
MERRLARLVEEESKAWAEGGKPPTQAVTFEMDRVCYEFLKGVANTIQGTNNRPLGVAKLIRGIVEGWLSKYLHELGPSNSSMDEKLPPVPRPTLK